MAKRKRSGPRLQYSNDRKAEAVQMMLDGHLAESVSTRLGLGSVNLLYRWKVNHLMTSGPAASALKNRV